MRIQVPATEKQPLLSAIPPAKVLVPVPVMLRRFAWRPPENVDVAVEVLVSEPFKSVLPPTES